MKREGVEVNFSQDIAKSSRAVRLPGPIDSTDSSCDWIERMRVAVRSGKRAMELTPLDKDVLVGAIDVASLAVETPEQVVATLKAAMKYVDPERTYPCTNCGLAPLPRDVSIGKLQALGAGARLLRKELKQRSKGKKRKKSKKGKKKK